MGRVHLVCTHPLGPFFKSFRLDTSNLVRPKLSEYSNSIHSTIPRKLFLGIVETEIRPRATLKFQRPLYLTKVILPTIPRKGFTRNSYISPSCQTIHTLRSGAVFRIFRQFGGIVYLRFTMYNCQNILKSPDRLFAIYDMKRGKKFP